MIIVKAKNVKHTATKGLKKEERTGDESHQGNINRITIAQNIEITPDNLSGIARNIA